MTCTYPGAATFPGPATFPGCVQVPVQNSTAGGDRDPEHRTFGPVSLADRPGAARRAHAGRGVPAQAGRATDTAHTWEELRPPPPPPVPSEFDRAMREWAEAVYGIGAALSAPRPPARKDRRYPAVPWQDSRVIFHDR